MRTRLAAAVQRLTRVGFRRFLPVVLLVAVLLVLHFTRPTPRAEAEPAPAPTASPTYSWRPYAPGYGRPVPSPSPTPDDQKPEALLAVQFLHTYLDTTGGKEAWLARLQPLAAGDLYDGLALTDLQNLPHATPGQLVSVTPTSRGDATVVVGSSAGDFRLFVARVDAGDRWQVNNIEPAGRAA